MGLASINFSDFFKFFDQLIHFENKLKKFHKDKRNFKILINIKETMHASLKDCYFEMEKFCGLMTAK